MIMTATELRKKIYSVIDQVAKTGVPVDVTRKGQTVRIIPTKKFSRLANLKRRNIFKCDPEEIVHMDWSNEWKPYI